MTNGRLFDTNAVIAIIEAEPAMQIYLAAHDYISTTSIVVGELYFGAYKSTKVEFNLKRIEAFVAANQVLNCDSETARLYGQVRNQLKTKGRPIPENDLWIGAVALQYNLVLVTRDAHFDEIDALQTESWST